MKVEHWPEYPQVRIWLGDEPRSDYGRDVTDGIVIHFRRQGDREIPVEIEIDPGSGRDLSTAEVDER